LPRVSEEYLTRGDSAHSDTVWSRSIPSYDIPEHWPRGEGSLSNYRVVFIPDWLSSDRIWFRTIEHMTIQRMDHVGIVVDDLAAATEFFVELGLVQQGEGALAVAGWTASLGSRAYGQTLR
jgi:hypothetical protein